MRIAGVLTEYSDSLQQSASYARALVDYDVQDDNLLSFKRGDRGESWHVGELRGKIGSFPAECVEILLGDPALLKDQSSTHLFQRVFSRI
jgi:hypothetical protein